MSLFFHFLFVASEWNNQGQRGVQMVIFSYKTLMVLEVVDQGSLELQFCTTMCMEASYMYMYLVPGSLIFMARHRHDS